MHNTYVVAIDGPSGAGKSTIAKLLAKELDIAYIDTGAMYRACAFYILDKMGNNATDEEIVGCLGDIDIKFENERIILNGEDISDKIRTGEVAAMASRVSALGEVRSLLVDMQRKMADSINVVMDGRDIGTNVFPQAEYKIFLTASLDERANRRYKELIERGENVSREKVKSDIEQRDYNDMNRTINPLRKSEDAIEVDSTGKDIKSVVDDILRLIKENQSLKRR